MLKGLGEDGEWSFGFRISSRAKPTDEWRAKGASRVLAGLEVIEASPVVQAAGIGTGTVQTRSSTRLAETAMIEFLRFQHHSRRFSVRGLGDGEREFLRYRRIVARGSS